MEKAYYRLKIEEEFFSRQRKNPKYSLRSYARFLGLDSSELSSILKTKRALPKKKASMVIDKLNLDPIEAAEFEKSLNYRKSTLAQLSMQKVETQTRNLLREIQDFKVISEWEHFTLVELIKTKCFQADMAWISERLNISKQRLKYVIENLIASGIIDKDFQLLKGNLCTSDDNKSRALKKSHIESLDLAKTKLLETDIHLREFSTISFPVKPENICVAKDLIKEFRKKLLSLMEDTEGTEVYQVGIQLYPLTNINLKEKS